MRAGRVSWQGFALAWLTASALLLALAIPADADAAATRCAGKQARPAERDLTRARSGGDAIVGSRRGDRIRGRGGDDRLCGRAGRDRLHGGGGRDRVSGGGDSDRITGGPGPDRLSGDGGQDRIDAADGSADTVSGGAGSDQIDAADGAVDRISCGQGFDIADADPEDRIRGCEGGAAPMGPTFALPGWADPLWSTPDKYETIQTVDLDGDGTDELIGRGPGGIETYQLDITPQSSALPASGHWMPLASGPAWDDAGGWDQPGNYETIQTARNLFGEGVNLLVRGDGNVQIYSWDGSAKQWVGVDGTLEELSNERGWNEPQFYETIQTARIQVGSTTRTALIARAMDGLQTFYYDDDIGIWIELGPLDALSDANGFEEQSHYQTIQTADLTGDGFDEVIARASDGIHFWSFDPQQEQWVEDKRNLPFASDAAGFDGPSYYGTMQTADVNGNGLPEVIIRHSDGIHEYELGSGGGGPWVELAPTGEFADSADWDLNGYYATIFAANLNGRGGDELIGRNASGLVAYSYDSGRWTLVGEDSGFSDAAGWGPDEYQLTIQGANVETPTGPGAVVVARQAAGIQSFENVEAQTAFEDLSPEFPAFNGADEQAAYDAISEYLGAPNWDDVREQYPISGSLSSFTSWKNRLDEAPQPAGVSDAAWSAVQGQLRREFSQGVDIATWFEGNDGPTGFVNRMFALDSNNLSVVLTNAQEELSASQSTSFSDYALDGISQMVGVVAIGAGAEGLEAADASMYLYLLSSAISAGIGPNGIDNAGKVEDDYAGMLDTIDGVFAGAQSGILDVERAIFADYGLMIVGDRFTSNGTWATSIDPSGSIAEAQRAFAIWAWQHMIGDLWLTYYDTYGEGLHAYDHCDGSTCYWLGGPAGKSFVDPETGNRFWEPGSSISGSLKDRLFGAPNCPTAWNAETCNLGASATDLIFGQNGWPSLPRWQCYDSDQYGYNCRPD